jgi:hypothetical protein
LEIFWGLEFLGESSEKGNTRISTGNRVTRWGIMYWGNLRDLRCFTKRILLGEFILAIFEDLGGVPRGSRRRGGTIVFLCALEECFVSIGRRVLCAISGWGDQLGSKVYKERGVTLKTV